MIEQRIITKEYFDVLDVRRRQLFDQAQDERGTPQFTETFDHIIRIHKLQLSLIPQIFNIRGRERLL